MTKSLFPSVALLRESVFLGSAGEFSFINESDEAKLQNEDVLFSIPCFGDLRIKLFENELPFKLSGSTAMEPCFATLLKCPDLIDLF